jgi:SAM-dependent methyltransferase
LRNILEQDPTVGAVGPSSNVVAGWQNMRHRGLPALVSVKYLIGFCCLIRRELLDEIGGLDESLPGGDDLDWSIEIRKRGFKLVARRDVFVYHHGFVTGHKVRGGPDAYNGWNSPKMTEDTNLAIIRKHGFKAFVETTRNQPEFYDINAQEYGDENCFKDIIKGTGIDVGCGASKITPETIGVDMVARGETTFQGAVSDADVKAEGTDLPFDDGHLDYVVARHNIEHYPNPIKALKEWWRVLKPGGYIGLSTPDDGRLEGMKLDLSHKHSFSRDCMKDMLELCGFEVKELGGTANQWNFYAIARKPVLEKAQCA